MSRKYWTKSNFEQLATAKSHKELFRIAEEVLARMPRPRVQVCGPISTGGAGSIEANIKIFTKAIDALTKQGVAVFDQTPFENAMYKIRMKNSPDNYDHDILNDFYSPIFENKLIDEAHFLPDWQTSTGASWEHDIASRHKVKIIYIDNIGQ